MEERTNARALPTARGKDGRGRASADEGVAGIAKFFAALCHSVVASPTREVDEQEKTKERSERPPINTVDKHRTLNSFTGKFTHSHYISHYFLPTTLQNLPYFVL